jgi:starch phosphorylase
MSTVQVAYFSMEIGLQSDVPTYAGGLGVLAGDTIRSAADLGIEMVAVTLLARSGYFHQEIDETGWQREQPESWVLESVLTEQAPRVSVNLKGRPVQIRAWRYDVEGRRGHRVPVFLLDTDLPENDAAARGLTEYLYGGDQEYRLSQEGILGIGGVRMLRALGYTNVERYHMNEGHSSLLVLELLGEQAREDGDPIVTREHIEQVRPHCIFTTHTPVPAGHDVFPLSMAHDILGPAGPFAELEHEFFHEGQLNMTYLALINSHYHNGVAKSHRITSQHMFAKYNIQSITNGVHVATWLSRPMCQLLEHHIADWRDDNMSLRYAISIPTEDIWQAHQGAKAELLAEVKRLTGVELDPNALTIGFARRATQYKRAGLIFRDPQRLIDMATKIGPIQFVFAGKAHPHDIEGKEQIQAIFRMRERLAGKIEIVYLPNYNMELAQLMTAGCDLWLNTPLPPLEASGTSGMKAAMNAVPSLSMLDGWWIEGCIEGVTGWGIKAGYTDLENYDPSNNVEHANALYDRLEHTILPMFYDRPDEYRAVMRHAMALNGSFFNTERMVTQYIAKAYFS